ncbi:MAG TPA: lysylphosphatidylglycerol synthase domain-containing protein, partial [Oligoflexia bacterium]|nr:lysylphosphatidylglycerol synthase domain-containing protein [Oligoflexia bacterium]
YFTSLLHSARAPQAVGLSFILWFFHLAQFVCFFKMFGASTPALLVIACVPLAVMVGLLPISFAGLGTRDAVLIWLFMSWDPPDLLAGVGLMSHLRYIVPALLGVPAVRYHLSAVKELRGESET